MVDIPEDVHELPTTVLMVARQYPDPRFVEYVLAAVVAVTTGVTLTTGHKHAKQIIAQQEVGQHEDQ